MNNSRTGNKSIDLTRFEWKIRSEFRNIQYNIIPARRILNLINMYTIRYCSMLIASVLTVKLPRIVFHFKHKSDGMYPLNCSQVLMNNLTVGQLTF